MNLLAHAITLSSSAHEHQLDKSGMPYILHPLRVMMLAQVSGHTEALQIAAVLHDIVEDTPTTLRCIEIEFGSQVVKVVDALTHRHDESGISLESYKEYIVRCCENPMARIIKGYDIQDNMDPRRYHKDAPYKRYIWALGHLQELKDLDRHRAEHGVVS